MADKLTAETWETCGDTRRMLNHLHDCGVTRCKTGRRKLRLLACACCRYIWDLLTDERSHRAVEVCELFVDGKASSSERAAAFRGAELAARVGHREFADAEEFARCAAMSALHLRRTAFDCTLDVLADVYFALKCSPQEMPPPGARTWRSALVREICGNPFRPVTRDRRWVTPNVLALAQAIYEERRWEELPILADALEEAGCDSETLLAHCRADTTHVRGCWAVDLVLGRD